MAALARGGGVRVPLRRFAFCDDAVVAVGAAANDAGMVHLRTRKRERAVMTKLTRLRSRQMPRGFADSGGAVVAGGAARRDAGVVEGGSGEGQRVLVTAFAGLLRFNV